MILISAQPWDQYFLWQIEVQIVNFRKFDLSKQMQVLVWYPKGTNYSFWDKLIKKYPEVSFFFYEDKDVNLGLYIPQLRPQILAQHFDRYPELTKEVIFYHDSDIIFNFLPNFELLTQGDINWQSDTSGYLDYAYLRRKEIEGNIPENEAIKVLCDIGKVSIETMQSYTGKTGGAQYILKNINGDFWRDVEKQVLEIRNAFFYNVPDSINKRYFASENAGFQSWCADMWAVNMALWSRGRTTNTTSELDFSWATDSAETYSAKPIFHNAGATKGSDGLFYKGKWISKSPIGHKHPVNKKSASYYYVKAIEDVK